MGRALTVESSSRALPTGFYSYNAGECLQATFAKEVFQKKVSVARKAGDHFDTVLRYVERNDLRANRFGIWMY
jgi:hypothetical protein